MNGYVAFYRRQRLELHAPTLYDAYRQAAEAFGVWGSRRESEVHVILAEIDGEPVTHVADF